MKGGLMARRNRGFFGWLVVLAVLALAGVGVYTVVKSSTGQSAVQAVEKTVKVGVKAVKAGAKAVKAGVRAVDEKVTEVRKK